MPILKLKKPATLTEVEKALLKCSLRIQQAVLAEPEQETEEHLNWRRLVEAELVSGRKRNRL